MTSGKKNRKTPSQAKIIKANKDLLLNRLCIDSEYHNNCWACGSQSSLQRAHVEPYCLNNNEEPENYFLLCELCHKEQPDVADREYQESWIINHESEITRIEREMALSIKYLKEQIEKNNLSDKYLLSVDCEKALNAEISLVASARKQVLKQNYLYHVCKDMLEQAKKSKSKFDREKIRLKKAERIQRHAQKLNEQSQKINIKDKN